MLTLIITRNHVAGTSVLLEKRAKRENLRGLVARLYYTFCHGLGGGGVKVISEGTNCPLAGGGGRSSPSMHVFKFLLC